ncbi:unnamed protein product [Prunus armeniaca]
MVKWSYCCDEAAVELLGLGWVWTATVWIGPSCWTADCAGLLCPSDTAKAWSGPYVVSAG